MEVLDHGVGNSELGDLEGRGEGGFSFSEHDRNTLNVLLVAGKRRGNGGFGLAQGDASIRLL